MSGDDEAHSFIHLQEQIDEMNERLDQVIINNRSLKKQILELTSENNHLYDNIYDIEVKLSNVFNILDAVISKYAIFRKKSAKRT